MYTRRYGGGKAPTFAREDHKCVNGVFAKIIHGLIAFVCRGTRKGNRKKREPKAQNAISWSHVGAMLRSLGAILAHLVPPWRHLGYMLCPS